MNKLPKHYTDFLEKHPELAAAYKALGDAALKSGPLDAKCVELVKLGASAGAGLESAVKSHARKASAAGATGDEIRHAALVSVTTLGFPRMMAALRWIDEALGDGSKD